VTGKFATGWLDDGDSALAKKLEVGLRGGMRPHVQVHGWSHEYRCLHGEVGGKEHVVGDTVSHLADCGGRSWGYDHHIGPKSQTDMAMPSTVALSEEFADNGL